MIAFLQIHKSNLVSSRYSFYEIKRVVSKLLLLVIATLEFILLTSQVPFFEGSKSRSPSVESCCSSSAMPAPSLIGGVGLEV